MRGSRTVRAYHEAGHALISLHVGAMVTEICITEQTNCTRHERASNDHEAALITLAGGVAEEVLFGERSPDCCTADIASFDQLHASLIARGEPCDRPEMEERIRELLRGPLRAALDVLAEELGQPWCSVMIGRRVLALLWENCPEVGASLRVSLGGKQKE